MKSTSGRQPTDDNQPAILVVLFAGKGTGHLQQAIAGMRAMHVRVAPIVAGCAQAQLADAAILPEATVPIEADAGRGRAIKAAARRARRLGLTHIVTVDADRMPSGQQLAKFLAAATASGDAIVVGRRDRLRAAGSGRGHAAGPSRLKNFWFRLQTGIRLEDAGSRLRAYPLSVLANLTVRANRNAFETEVLTRAAWAGVAIEEVEIDAALPAQDRRAPFWPSLRAGLEVLLMNVHLTMRSITPLPHRKIVSSGHRDREKISVLRPLKSIRTLLTENVTPRQLAAACGLGVFLGALPLIALHTMVMLFVSSYFRLNKVATVAASQLCMPPLVPALCIETGYFLRHGRFLTELSFETLGYQALERLWEWLLGSLVVAPVLAALVGGLVWMVAGLIKRGMHLGRQP